MQPIAPRAENDLVCSREQLAVAVFVVFLAFVAAPSRSAFVFAQTAAPQTASKTNPVPPAEARIDINRASTGELLKVPGMTASWAGRIVRFRPYRSKQDLLDRGVLPSDVYDRIKDYIIAHRD